MIALLYPQDGRWHLPLTLRPASLVHHASQISLPGGCLEAGETSEQAALRELTEELGVDAPGVRLLGGLSPLVVFRGGFRVRPWVGALEEAPVFDPSPAEVAELIEVPVDWLCDRRSQAVDRRQQEGIAFSAPCFVWRGHRIWGATAMILSELVALLDRAHGSDVRQ